MEINVKSTKQRNKRRERAQRMQAEREKDADGVGVVIADGDDSDDDSKKKSPIRPPQRRKKAQTASVAVAAITNNNNINNNNSSTFKEPSPILEEDIVDGFAILSFKTYEDLEYAIKLANKRNEKRLSAITELTTIMTEDQLPKLDTGQIKQEKEIDRDGRERERAWKFKNNHTNNNSSYSHDPGTSDDSGRASERLTTSSVAQRDQDSSRDRLSDASSRCSSGKGYICDSEGDDDKTSDGGSTSGAVVQRKTADIYPTGVPPTNNGPIGFGGSLSPSNIGRSSPAAPSPAPAALAPPTSLPPPPYATTAAPIQEMNESIGTTDMTSLPNNYIDIKTESNSNTESVPNGTSKVKPASPKKTSKANNNVVVKEEEPSNDVSNQATMKRPSTTDIGNETSKKYMQTISNLMVQSSTTTSTLPSNGVTNTNVAIPSPVSSTSSLSSISIPSRLGSSTPPISGGVPLHLSASAAVTNNSSANSNSQPMQIKAPLSSSANEINSQQTNPASSNVPLPTAMLTSPSPLSLPPMNGPLMGLSLNPLTSPSYRPLYSPYGLYPPYGIHPYQTIPNPALSPRSLAEQRRDPSLTMAKPLKPHSPNSASPQQQAPSNHSGAMGSTASANHHQESPSRNHSPMREKESILSKSMASTPNSVSISVISQPATAFTNSTSMLSPFNQPSPLGLSTANTYPVSSLSYPKAPSVLGQPPSWPPAPPVAVVSSGLMSSSLGRPLPVTTSHPSGNYGSSLFTAPLPPSAIPPTSTPLSFSAESLLSNKTDQADLLRRELDNRFLDRTLQQPSTVPPPAPSLHSSSNSSSMNQTSSTPPVIPVHTPTSSAQSQQQQQSSVPFLRQELHHHQHQHTHLHQHQHQSLLPTTPSGSLFPPPLFKDIPKIGAVDSPFYRTAPALVPGIPYPYPSGMLHQGMSGPTPFVPPAHLQSFTPKQHVNPAVVDPSKPKPVKTGRWNAMHVRIAWEIYHHQAKQNPEKASSVAGVKPDVRGHIYPPPSSPSVPRPHEMSSTPSPSFPPRTFDHLTANYLSSPSSHLGIPPFGRYASPFSSPFTTLSPYVRDMPIDPWRSRPLGAYPPPTQQMSTTWPLKPDPSLETARREAEERERERQRREKEERERKEKEREEKMKREREEREREQREREQREREQRERERERERKERERREMEHRERERMIQQQRMNDASKAAAARERSPLRNGDGDIRVKEEPRKDDNEMMMRAVNEQRAYQHSLAAWQMAQRHPHMLPPPRPGLYPMSPHFSPLGGPPPPPGWPNPLDPYGRDTYRFMDPMLRGYPQMNPMLDPLRVDAATAHYRSKNPSPVPTSVHQMVGHPQSHGMKPISSSSQNSMPITSNELHKKEDLSR